MNKKPVKTNVTSVKLPPHIKSQLDAFSISLDRKKNWIITKALQDFFLKESIFKVNVKPVGQKMNQQKERKNITITISGDLIDKLMGVESVFKDFEDRIDYLDFISDTRTDEEALEDCIDDVVKDILLKWIKEAKNKEKRIKENASQV